MAAAAAASIPDPYSMREDETSTDDESDDVDDEMDEYSDEDVGERNGQSTEYTEIKEQMYQVSMCNPELQNGDCILVEVRGSLSLNPLTDTATPCLA